jgi:hypothetical protein
MTKRISIPSRVCSDYQGYSFLCELHHTLQPLMMEQVELDFSKTSWFEANLCAALGAIINQANQRFNQIKLVNLLPAQSNIFSRNHFLASFGGEKIKDYNDTTIKYRRNKLSDDKLIKEFLYSELINKPDFPKLSNAAKNEIIRSIFEIYSNAILHGDCIDVYSCGQFYPRKTPPRIDFTIVDLGKTIQSNVCDYLRKEISGIDAIRWALQENNTTKPIEKNIPGGLGLKLICDFVRLNNGKVQIVSSNGCWQLSGKREESFTLDYSFPGTLVNLEFNLDDKSFYYLEEEKPETIIF